MQYTHRAGPALKFYILATRGQHSGEGAGTKMHKYILIPHFGGIGA